MSRDAGVIVGLSLTMLGIKALKVLPSIPFAPGHKLVLLTPLYVVASLPVTDGYRPLKRTLAMLDDADVLIWDALAQHYRR